LSSERPTSRPSSADSERNIRLYDRDLLERGAASRSTVPPSDLTVLEAPLALPEHSFYERLDDSSRRFEMLAAMLQAGGMTVQEGARAARAALRAIAASAEEASLPSMSAFARGLHEVISGLVPRATSPAGALDVLVYDTSEISRDLVSLSVEAHGHAARTAKSYDDFVSLLTERLPDIVVVDVASTNAPAAQLCSVLADLLEGSPTKLVLFAALPFRELERLKGIARAAAAIEKSEGVSALIAELALITSFAPASSRLPPP
jgi:CheY-like chemotaxis protein